MTARTNAQPTSSDDDLAPFPAIQGGLPIGYGRVSTRKQNLDAQIRALTAAGCAKIFTEQLSGRNTDRPELAACLAYLREGDILVVASLDRLARSMQDLITLTVDLRRRGIGFQSLRENLDTTTPGGRLVFHVFAALAEFIRELIVESTRDGIAAARARGQQLGRPKAMTDEQISHAIALLAQPKASARAIATLLGVSRSTLYTHVPQLAAIRTAAKAQPPAGAIAPAQRKSTANDPEPWWQRGDFTLTYDTFTRWKLTHSHAPGGGPINVDTWPDASNRRSRDVRAAQRAAGTAILELTGTAVSGWEEDQDGVGDRYWFAHQ
jgi:DNA invertase Pin-like site-specific DNA recombinase